MRQEAQAIVMAAGPGSRMTTVGFRAKCLLPIGNHPMIYYPLKFLQDSGFDGATRYFVDKARYLKGRFGILPEVPEYSKEATVLVNQKDEREIKKLNEVYGLKLKLDLVPVDTADDPGTAESLRSIESKIKKNVDEIAIISSDLITDASFLKIMNFHRSRGAALTILTANQNSEFTKAQPPGPKSKTTMNNDIICTEEGTNRLVYAVAAGDYDDYINVSNRIISSIEGGIDLSTDLIDGHLYVMKRWVVDYIVHKESPCAMMGSLKAEVIPRLISEQFTKLNTNSSDKSLQKFIKEDRFEDLIKKYNTSTVTSRFQPNSGLDSSVCYTFHHPGLCVRVNTMGSLWQVNKKFSELCEKLKMRNRKYVKGASNEINERAQICDQTVIGRSTQIAEKTNITKCVLGNHCRISSLVRISNSVLFDYVQVEQGCVIENSLICVNVEKKCVIKNCIVTDVTKITANKTYENELLEKGLSQDYSYIA